MPDTNSTTEQDLAALGIVASYTWKPNRLFIKNPNSDLGGSYIAADIVSDGLTEDVSAAVLAEGRNQITQITDISNRMKSLISEHERDYTLLKSNLEETYERMYNYFMSQGLIALATIMATAIVNLSLS